jgi:hypothetical protein
MTLLYRASWEDPEHVPPAVLDDAFRGWCQSKGADDIDIPYRGTATGRTGTIDIRRGDTESGHVYRGRLTEIKDGGERWTTTATAITTPDFRGYWIEVDCEAETDGRSIPIAAPRLVRLILGEPGSPHRGPVPISSEPAIVRPGADVDRLLQLLHDDSRDLPLVVFSPDERSPVAVNDERARLAAETLTGLAHVSLLWPEAAKLFNSALAEGMKVYGGALRVYLPGFSTTDDPTRHRYWGLHSFDRHPRRAGQRVALHLSRAQRWPDPPDVWPEVRHLVTRPTDEEFATRRATLIQGLSSRAEQTEDLRADNELLVTLVIAAERERDEALEEARRETAALNQPVESLQDQLLDAVAAMESATDENVALHRNLRLLALPAHGEVTDLGLDLDAVGAPSTPSMAIEMAREHLTLVEIPAGAVRDVDRLDQDVKDRVWATHTWQGLCALQRYAEAIRDGWSSGGFYIWCQQTAGWPTAKLAMTESETVMANADLASRRLLPVSTLVDTTGRVSMEAHLKIQPGGGPNIPRLYFHDDTKGPTGKVHVGFYGPHDLMPNTKTN